MSNRLLTLLQQMVVSLIMIAAVTVAYQTLAAPNAQSSVPIVIPYQGKLSDSAGTAINSSVNITFRFYAAASGGSALWTETHSSVTVSNGLFRVMLGSVTAIPTTVWSNNPLYVGVQVGSEAEMTPREQIGAVPYSIVAGNALSVADGAITQNKLNLTNGLTVTGDINFTGVLNSPKAYWSDYRAYIRFMKDKGVTDAQLCPEGGKATIVPSAYYSLNYKTGNEIAQARYPSAGTCVNVHSLAPGATINGDHYPYSAESCTTNFSGIWAPFQWSNGNDSAAYTTEMLGSGISSRLIKYACVQ